MPQLWRTDEKGGIMAAIRKIDLMHRTFGKDDAHKCRECSNILRDSYHGRTYIKCRVYGCTNSEASDWVLKWTACGMFGKEYTGNPIFRMVRPEHNEPHEQIQGQITIDDLIEPMKGENNA